MSQFSKLPELTPAQLEQLQQEWNAHPGMRHMGVRLELSTPGVVRAVVDPIREFHRGGMGTQAVNGAVIAGVFDLVIGFAGWVRTGGAQVGVAQLSAQYLRPVLGDRFTVEGRIVRAGRTFIFATAELEDENDVLCARCDGIVAVRAIDMPAPPAF